MSANTGKFFMLLKPNLNRKKGKKRKKKGEKRKKERKKEGGGEGRREKRRGEISVLLMVYFDLAILLVWQVTSIQQGNKGKKHRDRYGYIRPQFSSDVVLIMIIFKAGVCFMPLCSWIENN